jgi:hypothetical protein
MTKSRINLHLIVPFICAALYEKHTQQKIMFSLILLQIININDSLFTFDFKHFEFVQFQKWSCTLNWYLKSNPSSPGVQKYTNASSRQ